MSKYYRSYDLCSRYYVPRMFMSIMDYSNKIFRKETFLERKRSSHQKYSTKKLVIKKSRKFRGKH